MFIGLPPCFKEQVFYSVKVSLKKMVREEKSLKHQQPCHGWGEVLLRKKLLRISSTMFPYCKICLSLLLCVWDLYLSQLFGFYRTVCPNICQRMIKLVLEPKGYDLTSLNIRYKDQSFRGIANVSSFHEFTKFRTTVVWRVRGQVQ